MNSRRHIKIFDTTLRDGQQCPGAGMDPEKNLDYSTLARQLNVDVLEAGFPSASTLDFDIVRAISEEYGRYRQAPVVAALCQLRPEQVERTIEALRPAISKRQARLHTYVPVSPALMEASLGPRARDKNAIVAELYELVRMSIAAGCEVQFSPEGYSSVGKNFDFCSELIRAAVDAGATIINCPDTIGGAFLAEGQDYFVNNMKRHATIIAHEFPGAQITWSVHCHNDFGLAVSNSMSAVFGGPARQIEGCINGIGERAGNAALEQCIMLLKQFGAKVDSRDPFFTNIKTEHLQVISDFVSGNMLSRQPHWPVCGENAARHSSGGHTNAILKNPMAYQPFDPNDVGKTVSLVFGPLSGGNHAQSIIKSNGYVCNDNEKSAIAQFLKSRFEQRRKGVTDTELMAAYFAYRTPLHVDHIEYSKKDDCSEVALKGRFKGESFKVRQKHRSKDSALAALKVMLEEFFDRFDILSHRSESDGAGISAVSRSHIEIVAPNNNHYVGHGEDQDIEIAAMKALIDSLNRLYITQHYKSTQVESVSTVLLACS